VLLQRDRALSVEILQLQNISFEKDCNRQITLNYTQEPQSRFVAQLCESHFARYRASRLWQTENQTVPSFTARRYAKRGICRRRVSVVSVCHTQKAKRRITQIMPHDSHGNLVFLHQRSRRNSNGTTPYGGNKCRCMGWVKIGHFSRKKLENGTRYHCAKFGNDVVVSKIWKSQYLARMSLPQNWGFGAIWPSKMGSIWMKP